MTDYVYEIESADHKLCVKAGLAEGWLNEERVLHTSTWVSDLAWKLIDEAHEAGWYYAENLSPTQQEEVIVSTLITLFRENDMQMTTSKGSGIADREVVIE
jgi:hypothetical protein